MISILTWVYLDTKRERQLLDSKNCITYAITIKTIHRKRGQEVQYTYFVNGLKYIDWAKVPVINGESISIIVPDGKYKLKYYPKNPKINQIDLTTPIN
jgi:hypothetical protein